jgi:hypothetical protein
MDLKSCIHGTMDAWEAREASERHLHAEVREVKVENNGNIHIIFEEPVSFSGSKEKRIDFDMSLELYQVVDRGDSWLATSRYDNCQVVLAPPGFLGEHIPSYA